MSSGYDGRLLTSQPGSTPRVCTLPAQGQRVEPSGRECFDHLWKHLKHDEAKRNIANRLTSVRLAVAKLENTQSP